MKRRGLQTVYSPAYGLAAMLRPRGDRQPEVVVVRIRVLVAVEHGLPFQNLARRRPKHGDRHPERLRWPRGWRESTAPRDRDTHRDRVPRSVPKRQA